MHSSRKPPLPAAPLADSVDLMRMSEFERQYGVQPTSVDAESGGTRLSALNPSLLQDLLRHEPHPNLGLDLLEVMAAALRHRRALQLHLRLDWRVLKLGIWPHDLLLDSPMPLAQLLALRLPELQVLRVEPAQARADEDRTRAMPGAQGGSIEPLAPLLWELALRGSRSQLLAEVAGVAAYRVAPSANLAPLALGGSLADAVARLREQASTLREIARWPGFDCERAIRLLNALYLQASLMISRSHPGALSAQL